ncbi:MAG: 4-hydroxyphenylacetate 3-hydroxylase N-terminal domain-containing protein [Alphaproteobacteria bacterium]|jgi:4-hydroxyphenylacetate 3-monooxygenase|nr:4-hydroxyphenylacetate 3-hydroxylase N-terminal domain-containing protein [Alphaproteobacteria bacterium]
MDKQPVKNAAEHLESLRDERTVYLDGELVGDVTRHPAFRNAIQTAAGLYDYQADPANVELMTFESPTSGRRVNRAWQMPESYPELVRRREAIVAWAEQHGGFMGRSPDHLASAVTGQLMALGLFEQYDKERAKAFWNYYVFARDNDLFLTYVIINPQVDRSRPAIELENDDPMMRIVDEDSQGVTVRGAKMLGTSSIMANEVFVAHLQPLRADEVDYAISFAMPMATKGLKVLSRKSYEAHAGSEYDYPLAWRYDENDALMYFDDVKVPWERIFVHRDPEMCRRQFHDTPGHIYQNYQAQIRLTVKLKFLVGLARQITRTIGTGKIPSVTGALGKMAAQAAQVESMMWGMEAKGRHWGKYFVPDRHAVYAAQTLTQELYPEMVNTIRELAGGALVMLPSSATDFANPDLARIIESVQVSADGRTDKERIKLMKLAWDAVGSEFAGRHLQYEMFYAGAQFVTRGHSFRTYDWDKAEALVRGLMDHYDLAGSLEQT